MSYDHDNQCRLEGEARAAAHRLAHLLTPVQDRLAAELDAFDLLSADPAACRHRANDESLLAGMAAYCETAQAYNEQLLENLALTVEAMQSEARSAAFFKRQFALVHADWLREQHRSDTYLSTFQAALNPKKAA